MAQPFISSTSNRNYPIESEHRSAGQRSLSAMTLLRMLFFLLTLLYVLGMIAFGAAWTFLGERQWWVAMLVNFTPFLLLPAFLMFPGALLIRAKRSALLLLPVMVAAALLYASYFVPRAAVTAEPAWSLKVIAFNVSSRHQPMHRIEAWLRTMDADVVVLAEIDRAPDRTLPRMSDLYPHSIGQDRRNGVAILSRYPLSDPQGWGEDEAGYPHYPRITVHVGDQPVTVIGTSLDAPTGVRGRVLLPDTRIRLVNSAWDMLWGYSDVTRSAEVAAIVDYVAASPNPVIVAGDMNLVEQSSDYWQLASVLRDSYRETSTGFGFSFPAWEAFGLPPGLPPTMRIDYIWHTPDLVALTASYGPYVGSDHLPALATIGGG
ncbi:MAG: endonuclease/exonuclease/phosphatase family protein [Chloroflexi bacterium]|nr:endonuclease/exonuclease/phosphatase family protein [Chloroflexota bacterium]